MKSTFVALRRSTWGRVGAAQRATSYATCVAAAAVAGAAGARARAQELLESGDRAYAARDLEGAARAFAASAAAEPSARALYNLGVVSSEQGRLEDAVDAHTRSVALERSVDALVNLANLIYLVRRDAETAIKLYEEATTATNGSDGMVWYNLGCVCDEAAGTAADPQRRLGLLEKARAALARAVKENVGLAATLHRNVSMKLPGAQAAALAGTCIDNGKGKGEGNSNGN